LSNVNITNGVDKSGKDYLRVETKCRIIYREENGTITIFFDGVNPIYIRKGTKQYAGLLEMIKSNRCEKIGVYLIDGE